MSREYKVYLEDVAEAINKIQVYTENLTQQTFSADSRTFDAVLRNLEIIGEAIKRLPEDLRLGWSFRQQNSHKMV